MSEHVWKVGDIAFKPGVGVVGRVVGFGMTEPAMTFGGEVPGSETLKLESGDEILSEGCVLSNQGLLKLHAAAIAHLRELLLAVTKAGALAGLKGEDVLAVLRGVLQRQAALLK